MKLFEKKIDSELIYEGKIIDVRRDRVELENGNTAYREVTHHPGGVTVVALTEDNRVYIVRQFRYPYGKVLTELPAGKLEPGENPMAAAERELEEEIGVRAGKMIPLGEVYPTVAYNDEIIYMYLATDLVPTKQNLDDDEFLEVELIPLDTLIEQIMNHQICDSKTQAALWKVYYMQQK